MKQLLFVLIIFLGLSCSDNKEETFTTCECTDLTWLNEIKKTLTNCDEYTTKSIYQANYQEQTVFYVFITNNNPAALSIWRVTLWDCEGEEIRTFQGNEQEEFYELVTDMILLYSCK